MSTFTEQDFIITRNTYTGKYVIDHVSGFPVEGEHETMRMAYAARRALIAKGQFTLDGTRPII